MASGRRCLAALSAVGSPSEKLSLRTADLQPNGGCVQRAAAQPTVRAVQPAQVTAHNNLPSSATRGAAGDAARFRPPKDLVKLDDRLFYILQPPLESLIAAGAIEFPHPPFPYQLAGIGFLFPRHAAILADEMGLGKTMQAISTIRMLLHAREISRVLLICPKPLVSNWQREFQLWAPEIPLCVIEGSPATRAWQWQTADFPVKIANYEVVTRDQPVLADAAPHYDLVVLDEAQRIKNHRSTRPPKSSAVSTGPAAGP